MAPRSAWVLNLDADYELADPLGYTPSRAMQARVQAFAPALQGLVQPGDVVLSQQAPQRLPDAGAQGWVGRAWCPTPRALQALRHGGAQLPECPALPVLQRVNHRRFAIELDPGPLGVRYAETAATAALWLREPSFTGRWLLKRAFGLSGRGHRRIDGVPDAMDLQWIERSLRAGHGLAVEPLVERIVDVGLHALLARDGSVRFGQVVLQRCDTRGSWQQTLPLPADALLAHEGIELQRAAERAAAALHAAGYFGPFGIDAFAFVGPDGERGFAPLVEINARYSMGWPLSGLPV